MLKIENSFVSINCPLCNSESTYKIGNVNYSMPTYFSSQEILLELKPELWKCSNCYSGFIQKAIPKEVATSLYMYGSSSERWSYSKFEDSKCREVVDVLSKLFYKDAKIIDIGCNTGELLDFAKAKGCKTFGIEYSLESIAILEEKGHNVLTNLFENNTSYDVIAAFDLVEHLYNLPQFIKDCYFKLNKNGYLVILTGNIMSLTSIITNSNWWYVRFPEHIVFPSRRYFKLFSEFEIYSWIHTYASREYKYSLLSTLQQITKKLLRRRYDGLPSIGADHVLIVLKK